MPDSVTFTTLTAWECTGEEVCSLCRYHTAVLAYEVESDDHDFRPLQGYCCVDCAASLVIALEKVQKARLQMAGTNDSAALHSVLN